ncbi:TPA: hypothetical protein RNS87_000126 [Stenotrophomonas maltophilia]|nr:hypothetical protein [Stenotrophomonas maltophilia]
MATAGSIVIDLLMKTGSFVTDTQRAEKSMKSMERTAAGVSKGIVAGFTAIGSVIGGAIAAFASMDAAIILGGWSSGSGRMMATAYGKNDSRRATTAQPIDGQFASPGDPLKGVAPSMLQADLMTAGRLQANYLNEQMGRQVAGGRLLIGFLQQGQAVVKDLGPI